MKKNPVIKNKENHGKPSIQADAKKAFRAYVIAAIIVSIPLAFGLTAYATGGKAPAATAPVEVVNKLSEFIFGLIRAIGMIMLGFGIVQVGLSLKSHDASQRANGFLTLLGGVIIAFTKEILTLITG